MGVSKADKRRIAENAQFLRRFRIGVIVSNALYVTVRLVLKSASCSTPHYVAFTGTSVLLYVAHSALKSALEPGYDAMGQLIFAGSDLKMGGVTSYAQDVAYLCMFALACGAVTNYAWLVMLCIPLYAGFMLYKHIIGPYLMSRGNGGENVDGSEFDGVAEAKRRAKKERQRARMEKFRR